MRVLSLFLLLTFPVLVVPAQNITQAWHKNVLPLADTNSPNSHGGIWPLDANLMIVSGTYDDDASISCIDSNGVMQWRAIFGGDALDGDQVVSVYVASTGLIYVTGYLVNEATDWDLFVKCYTASGSEVFSWVHDGGMGLRDQGSSVIANNYGEVFVCGYLRSGTALKTAYLACLSSTGNLQWDQLSTGTASGDCSYNSLHILNGTLYVSGNIVNTVTNSDGVIESRSFAGALNWSYLYDNNNTNGSYSLIRENNGDLYVCGSSGGLIVTRISPAGVAAWTTSVGFDYAHNMAFQSDGDIIVSGADQVSSNTEIRLCCLRDTGSINWFYTYVPSPYNGTDQPSGLAVAPNDEIYVTGFQTMALGNPDQLLMKFSPSGNLTWTRRRNGTMVTFTSEYANGLRLYAGRIVTAGKLHNSGTGEDATVSAYNYAGTSLFLQQYNGGFGVTRDVQMKNTVANTIVVATAADTNSIVLEEYSQGGTTLQRDTVHCPGTGMPWLKTMAADGAGNIYLGALFDGTAGNYDIWIAKLDSSLDTAWTAIFAGSTIASEDVADIDIDASGNVYVAGSGTLNSDSGAIVLKYSPAGILLDTGLYRTTTTPFASSHELLITSSGEIYLLANLRSATTGYDVTLLRLDAACDSMWMRSMSSAVAGGTDIPGSIHQYSNGDIGVTGSFYNTATDADVFARRYDSNGNLVWSYTLVDPQLNLYDRAIAGTVFNDTLYFTGWRGAVSGPDYLTVAVDAAGNGLWWRAYDGNVGSQDEAHDITFDAFSRSIFVTGEALQNFAQEDITTLRYDVNGTPLDTIVEWLGSAVDRGMDVLSFTNDGSIYVAADRGNVMARVIKYCVGGALNTQTTSAQLCAGDSVQLTAPAGYIYQWSPAVFISDDTIQSPLVYPPSNITYTLAISSLNGCSAAHFYNVAIAPATQLQLAFQSASLCFGDSIQLQASGLSVYNWSPALYLSDSTLADPMAYGADTITYIVSGPDIFGCSTHTDSVEVVVHALPVVSFILSLPDTVCNAAGSLVLGGGSPAGGQYTGTGVSGVNFYPALADSGFNVITYTYTDISTGCTAFMVDSVYVDICNSIAGTAQQEFSLYPVPAGEYVVIQSHGQLIAQIEIVNLQGAVLFTSAEAIGSTSYTLDVNDLVAGTYFMRVTTVSGISLLRFSVL